VGERDGGKADPAPETRTTVLRRQAQYRDRWSGFGGEAGILQLSEVPTVEQLRSYEIFAGQRDSLLKKIGPDVSIATYEAGRVLFEEGTYINLAFYVIRGEVEASLETLGPRAPLASPRFDAQRTAVVAIEDRVAAPTVAATSIGRKRPGPKEIVFLTAAAFDLPRGDTRVLGPGELFGEIGATSGWPQSITARTRTECELLQIRLPALLLLKGSKEFKERVDRVYRERSLSAQLRTTPLLSGLPDATIEELRQKVELVSCTPGEPIVTEGDPVDAIYLVRSGFVKLAQTFQRGVLTVSYLSKGMVLGDVELVAGEVRTWSSSASSVEYSELVKIPYDLARSIADRHPDLMQGLWRTGVQRVQEIAATRRDLGGAEFIDVALQDGLVQGNSILVIDLDVCTRCDDCVRACAATHGGRPRFVREGSKYANLLIAKSCYHCRDPVCLVGCPTGAIHRAGALDVVEIDEEICIGCNTCAANCPYDQIVMLDTGSQWKLEDMGPKHLIGEQRLVASKCDLCSGTGHGPACVSNCPQACAYRVGSIAEFERVLRRPESGAP
jgi:Fe-S-cluster-containing dehydrogenase component/CRP-like cAMP-binding protein